jgi:ABC-type sugar transport system permease subunit
MLLPAILLVALFFYYPFLSGVRTPQRRYAAQPQPHKWIGRTIREVVHEREFMLTIPITSNGCFLAPVPILIGLSGIVPDAKFADAPVSGRHSFQGPCRAF